MFKVLSRLATPFAAAGNAAPAIAPEPDDDPDLFPILVSRSALDVAGDNVAPLLADLTDYVNTLTLKGRFYPDELPPRAMQAFHMDSYLAQVKSAGHAQFLRGCGAERARIVADLFAGLEAADAAEQLMVLRKLTEWLDAKPAEAARLTGLAPGLSPAFAKFDKLFAAVEARFPLRPKIAAYVASAPELKALPDLQLEDAREKLCDLNPDRGIRDRILSISGLDAQLTDPFTTALALAAGKAEPPAPLARLGHASHHNVDGKERLCFDVETTAGHRWAVVADGGVALHAATGQSGPGARLALATETEAARVSELARALKIGATVDLLLSRLIQPPRVDRITIQAAGPDEGGVQAMSLMLVLNNGTATMSAQVSETEALLRQEPEHKQVTKAMRAEIDNYAAEYSREHRPDQDDELSPDAEDDL